MTIKGTKTEENLWTAFAGESQTRNKYAFFAEMARQEGHENISAVFERISNQEKEHAKTIFSFLDALKDTKSNLKLSAHSEHYEGDTMYKEFERIAHQEGFDEIAEFFARVGKIELEHEQIFLSLLHKLNEKK